MKKKMGDPLDMLGEEANEVSKEIFKAHRFGIDEEYTGTDPKFAHYLNTTPRSRIVQEVGDFLVAIDLCVRAGYFTPAQLSAAFKGKKAQLKKMFPDET